MVEEETLGKGPKGRGKEELGNSESHSIPWVSRRPRHDKTTQLPRIQERRRDTVFVCFGMKEMGGLYSSGGENMNGILFNEGWQRIMNLDLVLALGEIWWLNGKIYGSEEQAKFGFPVATVTTYRANFEKSYLT